MVIFADWLEEQGQQYHCDVIRDFCRDWDKNIMLPMQDILDWLEWKPTTQHTMDKLKSRAKPNAVGTAGRPKHIGDYGA